MVDIIMVTYNRLSFTKQSLGSILNRTDNPHRVIVVDNGSNPDTVAYLKSLHYRKGVGPLILNEENEGLERALNKGFGIIKSEPYFITVDNDCIAPRLTPCWLTQLVELMEKYKDYAAIALRPQILVGVGPIFRAEDEVVENNVVGGSFRIMRTEAVSAVGGWTDKFEKDGRGNEEHDICGKMRSNGWKVGYARNLWTYHLFGDEGTWGYEKDSNYKMGRVLEHSPEDVPYHNLTCEPKIKFNE